MPVANLSIDKTAFFCSSMKEVGAVQPPPPPLPKLLRVKLATALFFRMILFLSHHFFSLFFRALGAQFFTSLPLSLLVPSFISGNGGSGSRIIIIITIVLIAVPITFHARPLSPLSLSLGLFICWSSSPSSSSSSSFPSFFCHYCINTRCRQLFSRRSATTRHSLTHSLSNTVGPMWVL